MDKDNIDIQPEINSKDISRMTKEMDSHTNIGHPPPHISGDGKKESVTGMESTNKTTGMFREDTGRTRSMGGANNHGRKQIKSTKVRG